MKRTSKTLMTLGIASLLAGGAAGLLTGCDDDVDSAGDVGDKIDDAADNVGDAMDDAADDVKDAVDGH